jgi:hypothetical protein
MCVICITENESACTYIEGTTNPRRFPMSWIVAGVLGVIGVIGAVGLYLGLRDPVTRRYTPNISGLFLIGRPLRPPAHMKRRENDRNE